MMKNNIEIKSIQMNQTDSPQTIDWRSLRPQVTDALLMEITRRIVENFHPEKVINVAKFQYPFNNKKPVILI